MYTRRFTLKWISELEPNEIFVFGSNLAGAHAGGAAHIVLSTPSTTMPTAVRIIGNMVPRSPLSRSRQMVP